MENIFTFHKTVRGYNHIRKDEEDTDYRFIDDLLPWSDSIPDICKMKNKKEH